MDTYPKSNLQSQNLPGQNIPGLEIIDSHAHLMREFFGDEQNTVIERSMAANVRPIINPGINFESIPELISLSEEYAEIFIAVGLHPHEARNWSDSSRQILKQAAIHPKVVAIGECGLDFYYNNSPAQEQIAVLIEQIRLAKEFNKPIIIHCRDAWQELKQILKQEGAGLTGVLHCFTGNIEVLTLLSEFDFYISYSGIVTFPKAQDLQNTVAQVHPERIMVETDCPFLAPQRVRGQRNEPAHIWFTAEKLAELRGVTLATMSKLCSNNARRLFKLPLPQQSTPHPHTSD